MNKELMEAMSEYKQITFNMMYCLENYKLDELDDLFSRRQQIIDSLKNINYTKEEGEAVLQKLDLRKLESEIKDLADKKKLDLSSEMRKFFQGRKASNAYRGRGATASMYFNKKI